MAPPTSPQATPTGSTSASPVTWPKSWIQYEASLHLADSKYSELDLGQQNWEEVRKITNYQTETGSWPHVVAENKEYKIKLL